SSAVRDRRYCSENVPLPVYGAVSWPYVAVASPFGRQELMPGGQRPPLQQDSCSRIRRLAQTF
ncbi:MAG TPA: hypothetical protein VMX16_11605, partial [Terriglobia bacterium]|nr:hypothetical protein [Terriglobia bacterium]